MLDRDCVPVKTSCVAYKGCRSFHTHRQVVSFSILKILKLCSSRRWKSEIESQNADNAILSTMLVKK